METTEVVKVHPHDTEERVDKGARLENQVKAQTPQNWRENLKIQKRNCMPIWLLYGWQFANLENVEHYQVSCYRVIYGSGAIPERPLNQAVW